MVVLMKISCEKHPMILYIPHRNNRSSISIPLRDYIWYVMFHWSDTPQWRFNYENGILNFCTILQFTILLSCKTTTNYEVDFNFIALADNGYQDYHF